MLFNNFFDTIFIGKVKWDLQILIQLAPENGEVNESYDELWI